jgi:glycosyltransferase involved in cell wall biosynthesis
MDRLNILQVHQHLGIGGVESYLIRLTAGLSARGHRVIILTEGGCKEKEAEAAGAKLIKIKFDPFYLNEAIHELTFDHQSFNIVHAHNYKSARFARKLAHRLGIPYLMSVHGPRPFWQRFFFRDWSKPTIVMSEGDLKNITGIFGIKREHILLSFYGVDTDRFRPGLDTSQLYAEFGLTKKNQIIVHISRFSHRKALVALTLLDAFVSLASERDNLVLLLVGDGPQKHRIEQKAETINRRLKRCAVILTGIRMDMELIMNLADVVVATANTALEAMSCGVPTIAFGRTGYFGIVTPDNFEAARSVCFGDHGRCQTKAILQALVNDIRFLLTNEDARSIALDNRHIIEAKYSLNQMAAQMEEIYYSVIASSGVKGRGD